MMLSETWLAKAGHPELGDNATFYRIDSRGGGRSGGRPEIVFKSLFFLDTVIAEG